MKKQREVKKGMKNNKRESRKRWKGKEEERRSKARERERKRVTESIKILHRQAMI